MLHFWIRRFWDPEHERDHTHDPNLQGTLVLLSPSQHEHKPNAIKAIFFHILADTLGSVGVVISTVLIRTFGWSGFDALASILIAVLITLSILPLIKTSATALMLRIPESSYPKVEHALDEVSDVGYDQNRSSSNTNTICAPSSLHSQRSARTPTTGFGTMVPVTH